METTIKKKLTLDEMKIVHEKFNIRWYEPCNRMYEKEPPLKRQRILFSIRLRHEENECPKEILKNVVL
jgi:hypothetical protein